MLAVAAVGVWAWSSLRENGGDPDPVAAGVTPSETETSAPPAEEETTAEQVESEEVETSEVESEEVETTEDVSETVEEETAESLGSCALDAFPQDGSYELSLYCDGQWHFVAQPYSSHFALLRWNGTSWESYGPHGRNGVSKAFTCYSGEILEADGAPAGLFDALQEYYSVCELNGSYVLD